MVKDKNKPPLFRLNVVKLEEFQATELIIFIIL